MPSLSSPTPPGRASMWATAGPTPPWTSLPGRSGWRGKTFSFPIGYDAFGLPTENYAIKNHIHPRIVTEDRTSPPSADSWKALGYSFDWDREINTTDPKYFKWTQWIFLQMFRHGLAYKTTMPVNWCTSCKCVLANEEVVEGVCERCGAPVVRKEKESVDAQDHRVCPAAHRRSGRSGLHRAGEAPAEELDRPEPWGGRSPSPPPRGR